MSTRINYFSRCDGHVVSLGRVNYSVRAVQLAVVAYEGQTQFVRNSRTSPTCTLEAASAAIQRGYLYAVGICESCGLTHAADRIIDRGFSPSGHLCDARCRFARGPQCECSCGGKWHGAGDVRPGQGNLFTAEVAA